MPVRRPDVRHDAPGFPGLSRGRRLSRRRRPAGSLREIPLIGGLRRKDAERASRQHPELVLYRWSVVPRDGPSSPWAAAPASAQASPAPTQPATNGASLWFPWIASEMYKHVLA